MSKDSKYRLWASTGIIMILFCTPIGIYSGILGSRILRFLKIGDYEQIEKCVSRIKICGIIVIAFYVLAIILGSLGVLD